MAETKNRVLTLLLTAGILLGFAVADYVLPQIMHAGRHDDFTDWFIAIGLGVCVAQVMLISAWAVFAPGNFVVRLPWSLLLGLMMWYILAISQREAAFYSYAQNLVQLGINILVGVTVLQIPLWIAKRALRYRMLSPGEAIVPTASERMQFEVKHLLIATFLLAIALSPLRLILPAEPLTHFRYEWEMFALVGAGISVNLVATLPCFWGGFVSSSRVIVLVPCWLAYSLVVTGVEFAGLCMALSYPPDAIKTYFLVYVVNVTQGGVVFGVMYCYRALGYRLLRVPREMPLP